MKPLCPLDTVITSGQHWKDSCQLPYKNDESNEYERISSKMYVVRVLCLQANSLKIILWKSMYIGGFLNHRMYYF